MTGLKHLSLTPLATLLAALPLTTQALESATPAGVSDLPPVSITATRLSKAADEVAPNISVLPGDANDAASARNLQTVLDDEPGVSVNRDPARRGIGSINLRGIEGNRVLMQIDGIALPALYQGGGAPISGRDMVELDTLSAIEIAKGPYSGLYGADAIGGVVAYRTLEAADLLQPGRERGGRFSSGFHAADASYKLGAAHGWQAGELSAVLAYTARHGEETDNRGDRSSLDASRTRPNPQQWQSDAVLAKLGWQLAPGHTVSLTRDIFSREQDSDLITSRTGAITAQVANDQALRQRTSLHYDYTRQGSGLVGARINLHSQHGESREYALEQRSGNVLRTNQSGFLQDSQGLNGQMTYRLDQGDTLHTLVWGAEAQRTETSRPRYRLQRNADGSSTNVVGGEVFPQKTFPDNDSERLGLFVQDEILFASGISLTPSLRYDRFTLTPRPDALFAAANPSSYTVSRYRDSAISPRLSLSVPLATGWTGFAQAGTGFRAPNFDDAMLVFSNAAQGYEILPNPALKAERSQGAEIGARYRGADLLFSATGFHHRYRDFIENVMVSPRDTNANGIAMEFQSRNVARVRIEGLELQTRWTPQDALSLRAGLSWARGTKLGDHTPLDSLDPLRGSLAADYRLDHWTATLAVRGAKRKTRVSAATVWQAPGYGVIDLSLRYMPRPDLTLTTGIYNLGDKKYWLWSDVKGQPASSAVLDRYTQPGRHAGIHLDYRF
ncbi:TonB-dependent hemoglobin/transferrin/lactoferrin family receptor [Chitinimonas sp. BJYL2]|uniref:TonB-dependent hemoglobin/transferrin/lactoferrin family receptor n=1 Tax=Chitinimonas sp. BJYL2 TaxID=2976696 RepID=UPI0022B5CCDC|nr:TonB-dependent hemoglobin/transferrin/lactoferrin family receptor [Chitinimonas sp. BJYL2]